jgi:site-specific recombinase XerD
MYIQQEFSLLFFLRLKRTDKKTGKAQLCYRLKIDGASLDRSVKGVKLLPDHWDNEAKIVKTDERQYKAFNKKITNLKTDLERHFDLIQAKSEIATPALVLNAYKTPLRADKRKDEKQQNLALSQEIDDFIIRYLKFNDKWVKAYKHKRIPYPVEEALLAAQKTEMKEEFDVLVKKANKIFDDKGWEKTVILAADEHLLHFTALALAGERSPNTLEKMWGRKKRYVDFLRDRYDTDHLPLSVVQYKFIDQLLSYNILQHEMIENSAMKYVQTIKEVFTRAVSIGWLSANVFDNYHCHYNDVNQDWLPMDEMIRMINFKFSRPKLNEIRDIYVFASFSGYAYAEIDSAGYDDLRVGVDGKQWIGKDRQKTGEDETLPLLPICLEIIERYRNHPVCIRRKSLLPVPSCEEYNRCLKEIGAEMGLNIELTTHTARYFFANVVANDNGLELRITGQLLGQKSLKTTAKYVKKNKRLLAENMQQVENNLFHQDGSLRNKKHPATNQGAKVITLRIV